MVEENSIKDNLIRFSFPRLSGTEGEKKALELATQKVEELGIKPLTQDFVFSTFFSRIYPKLAFLLGFIVLFLYYLNFKTFIIPLLLIIICVILGFLFILMRKPESIRLPKLLHSSNLYAKVGIKPRKNHSDISIIDKIDNKRNILFICHLDSKGQRFSIRYRIKIIRTWVFSGLIILVIFILKNYIFTLFSLFLYLIGIVPIVINLSVTILFLLNTTNNESNGAIDNASGIVCVLELMSLMELLIMLQGWYAYLNYSLIFQNQNLE